MDLIRMTAKVPTSLIPNVLAALPGRMVDEAPKRHSVADRGAREGKLTPTIFGLLGGAIMAFFLVWYDVLTVLLDGEGVMLYLGPSAWSAPCSSGWQRASAGTPT